MSQKILDALAKLDPANAEHWTNDGLPRLDVVEEFLGEDTSRAVLNEIAKGFNRKNPVLDSTDPQPNSSVDQNENSDTQTQQNDASTSQGDENENPDEEAPDEETQESKKEKNPLELLEVAREALNEAQANYKQAEAEADAYIIETEEENQSNLADEVKAYQRSQQEQRKALASKK